MQGLTKRENRVTDPTEIIRILDTAKVLHLGLSVNDEPYVVPMNYGYTMEEGRLVLYLHSALRGKKLDMIRANPKVFFELETDLVPFEGKVACQYGLAYSSVMGRGTARIVEDVEEKKKAMSILMKTQTGKDFSFALRVSRTFPSPSYTHTHTTRPYSPGFQRVPLIWVRPVSRLSLSYTSLYSKNSAFSLYV